MNVAELLKERFGIGTYTKASDPTATVGTSATEILDNDPNRLAVVIVNLSANDLYIGWDLDVDTDHGIYLSPSGGSFSITFEDDFMLPTQKMYALAGGAGSEVFRQEIMIDQSVKREG